MSRAFDPEQLDHEMPTYDPHWENHQYSEDERVAELERRHQEELDKAAREHRIVRVPSLPKL